MSGAIEAVHIFDDNRSPILSHAYAGRPLSAAHLLPLYLEHAAPRPNLIYLANTNPPTLVFSLTHGHLLFLATSSSEIEPLLVLEFLHRIIDAFEDFVGAPLLAVKIENNYDIVAQLLTEMCDAGNKITVQFWLEHTRDITHDRDSITMAASKLTLAPSGRPLAAFANGTIAFTAKVSGVPDITVNLTSPSGKHNLGSFMELPVFHPCVRLNRWKERPGELSFVPPDGRFILAGYEVDLLPFTSGKSGNLSSSSLKLPVNLEMKTGMGPTGSEFEVRLQVNKIFSTPGSSSSSQLGRGGGPGRLGSPHPGTPASPSLDDLVVTIPLPTDVRNLSDIRPSRGDASFNPGQRILEWYIPAKELSGPTSHFGLRSTVVGALSNEPQEDAFDPSGFGLGQDYSYNEPYQSVPVANIAQGSHGSKAKESGSGEQDAKKAAQNKILMPSSASVNFSVKGWLASGLKVDSIVLDTRKSRGLGEGVKPYKGVKYLTVSKGGVELRC
ncbi:adaptor complexes medium subunit family protein [Beauveria brongniartii RCEF 3172]|uniref:Adaptor complexes medium subunit family protein n=1 Tax=Beauveria brongniartii RCEF 3172 TaxID=1081107 RepID=A0A166Y6T9_9HYPO|nr:adaptor complexes medium subunit family protein [Beauveria brongniartii RCEF 3172]